MLYSARLYFTACNISCFTLRYFCSATKLQCRWPVSNPARHSCLTVVTLYALAPFPEGLNYDSATVAVLFPTYSNTCSDRYVVRPLTLIFNSVV